MSTLPWTALLAVAAGVAAAAESPSDTLAFAERLQQGGYPVAAAATYVEALKSKGAQPLDRALIGLMTIRETLSDDLYVLSLLEGVEAPDASLPRGAAEQLRYLRGVAAMRRGRLEEAVALLEGVTPMAPVYAKARYLLGVIRADARLPGGARPDEAVRLFEEVLSLHSNQEELKRVQGLSRLGLGRIRYAQGEYALASQAYEAVPRFSRFWGEALLENAFARFRRDDLGGALGLLETLHAPQFEGAFQPESWILKASVFYFSCLTGEAQAAVQAFEQIYRPVAKTLDTWNGKGPQDPAAFVQLLAKGDSGLPRGLRQWVRRHEPVDAALQLRTRATEEAQRAAKDSGVGSAGVDAARKAEAQLTMLAGNLIRGRLQEARADLKRLAEQADVVRVETSKADKELVQAGVDQLALLARQRLYRPARPGDAWEYWQFDGEYWLDEMGYYQYTLKRGCPPRAEEKTPRHR